MKRLLLACLLGLTVGLGLTACESRNGGGLYVEGTGGVNVGN